MPSYLNCIEPKSIFDNISYQNDRNYFCPSIFTAQKVYSAGVFSRDTSKPSYSRPDSNWHYMENGLCGSSVPERESFYSNLASIGSNNFEYCSQLQPLGTYIKFVFL